MNISTLRKRDLPVDWKERHGQAVEAEMFRFYVAYYTRRHRETVSDSLDRPKAMVAFREDLLSSNPLQLSLALRMYNRTAFCYVFGQERTLYDRKLYPVKSRQWLAEAWDHMAESSAVKELYDGRFPLGCVILSNQEDNRRFRRWTANSSGKEACEAVQHEDDVAALIDRHLKLCDLVEARATGPGQPNDAAYVKYSPTADQETDHIHYFHSSLFPTCKAVLAISPMDMTEERTLWLVLTGHNQDLRSGPPSFDGIHTSDIISRPRNNIAEVRLCVAVDYLQALLAKEEAVNEALEKKNNERYEAMIEYLHGQAREQLEGVMRLFEQQDDDKPIDPLIQIGMRAAMSEELQAMTTDEGRLRWLRHPHNKAPWDTIPAS